MLCFVYLLLCVDARVLDDKERQEMLKIMLNVIEIFCFTSFSMFQI